MAYDYLRDPQKIESLSFARIRECTALANFDEQQAQVAMRVVHTCGLPDTAQHLRFTTAAVANGISALALNKPVLCDVAMLAQGISRRFIHSPVHCHLNDSGVADRAISSGQTRSMAALDYWQPHLEGAIAVIGNAPTALFRLLEMIHHGAPRPALIIGVPVGFIGAVESKEALWKECESMSLEVITLLGRQGGSAIASAIVNALGRIQKGVYL